MFEGLHVSSQLLNLRVSSEYISFGRPAFFQVAQLEERSGFGFDPGSPAKSIKYIDTNVLRL